MKEITILGETFFYKSCDEMDDGEFYCHAYTEFFKEIKISKRKKYYFFGDIIEIREPIILFKVNYSLTDIRIPRSYMKKVVEEACEEWRELLNRKEEIANGEFI